MLDVRGLSLSLGEFSLDGVDLTVDDGEYFIILGPTGAGKTILLEPFAGIFAPASGTFSPDGLVFPRTDPKARGIGMVYQAYMPSPTSPWKRISGLASCSERLNQTGSGSW